MNYHHLETGLAPCFFENSRKSRTYAVSTGLTSGGTRPKVYFTEFLGNLDMLRIRGISLFIDFLSLLQHISSYNASQQERQFITRLKKWAASWQLRLKGGYGFV